MSNVSSTIKSIQDIMRKDVGVDGDAQRLSQLVWMFFLKIYDDREAEIELLEDNYKSPLPEEFRWRNWAADPEGRTGEELSEFVTRLFDTLKNGLKLTGKQGKRAAVIRNVFEDAYNYMKSGTLMRQVINKICEINFNNTQDRHTFGGIYEQLLKDLQSAGNAGEFYTPRAVTQFIINQIDPKLDETVLDPACGTGGFLSCAIDYKRENYLKNSDDDVILVNSIHGVEKKALPHMLCTTNMILHGIDTPTQIEHSNMLSRRPYKDYGEKDRVDIIVTNPPFGGMEEDGVENQFPANFRTRETADLFMALVIKLLKNGGRAAVVLPDGFMFGEGMKTRLKEHLLTECNLHTVVRLPNSVFAPYTGIKTNILFFEKGTPTKDVWYYEVPLPAGIKAFNKTKPMKLEDFAACADWWGEGKRQSVKAKRKNRVENEQAWKVTRDEIIARNYNLNIPNPHVGEQISHDPDELLATYAQQQQQIQGLRDQLKSILSAALEGKN